MKANHNIGNTFHKNLKAVPYGSKILKWKQITTVNRKEGMTFSCSLWFKDTKMKANHNCDSCYLLRDSAVPYGSKILKWKQITTVNRKEGMTFSCSLWFKDTKMKANHNCDSCYLLRDSAVPYGSKILKWKQITT